MRLADGRLREAFSTLSPTERRSIAELLRQGHYQLNNTPHRNKLPRHHSKPKAALCPTYHSAPCRLKENTRMIRQMIRQWGNKLLEALRRAVARSTTLDEVIFGAILGFILVIILTFLGIFD